MNLLLRLSISSIRYRQRTRLASTSTAIATMSTPAKTGPVRPDENGLKSGFNPSDTETNMGGPDATESVAAGGDQDADGEDDGQDAGEEGGSANTNVLEYLKRNTHMKAVDMFEKKRQEEQQASAGGVGGSGNTTDVSSARPAVDQALRANVLKPAGITTMPSSATLTTQQPRTQLPTPDEGLPAKDLIKRNLPQAQASSASTSAYYLTPDFIAQAEDVINRQKASAQANAAATNASIGKALASDQNAGQGAGTPNVLLDQTDRVMGYLKLREWVEAGLEGWKVSSSCQ